MSMKTGGVVTAFLVVGAGIAIGFTVAPRKHDPPADRHLQPRTTTTYVLTPAETKRDAVFQLDLLDTTAKTAPKDETGEVMLLAQTDALISDLRRIHDIPYVDRQINRAELMVDWCLPCFDRLESARP